MQSQYTFPTLTGTARTVPWGDARSPPRPGSYHSRSSYEGRAHCSHDILSNGDQSSRHRICQGVVLWEGQPNLKNFIGTGRADLESPITFTLNPDRNTTRELSQFLGARGLGEYLMHQFVCAIPKEPFQTQNECSMSSHWLQLRGGCWSEVGLRSNHFRPLRCATSRGSTRASVCLRTLSRMRNRLRRPSSSRQRLL